MDIIQILTVLQLINSVAIVALVLIQKPDAGFYSQSTTVNNTKTGSEKLINNITIFFITLFILTAISLVVFK